MTTDYQILTINGRLLVDQRRVCDGSTSPPRAEVVIVQVMERRVDITSAGLLAVVNEDVLARRAG